MLFATTLSFGPPLFADAGSTSAVFVAFRYQVEMSTRSVTLSVCPSWSVIGGTRLAFWLWSTSDVKVKSLRVPAPVPVPWTKVPITRIEMVAKSGLAAMKAASSLELGLWTLNSSSSNVPAGALIDTSCAMTALPSGSVSSLEPVSKSSQSPFPRIASHDATSARLSSTFRNTSWALRTMTVSGASAITVLSPAAVTLGAGAGAPLENAALGPGDAALPAVISARLIEEAGFPAIATSSAGVAWALGWPDGERISRGEMLAVVRRIAVSVRIPVTADVEAGYGPTPEAAAETARGVIAAGAIGLNLEDGTNEGSLMDLAMQVERIRAVRQAGAADGVPMGVNAGSDAFEVKQRTPGARFAAAGRRATA